MERKEIGMVIWVGEDRFVQYRVDLQDPEIRATFNDVRSYISVSASVRLFALEFTSRFKVFTIYRHASDRQGRPGFLAVTLFVPYALTVGNLTGLLEAVSLKYYKDHYGLGGVLRPEAPVYEEVYTQELERLLRTDHPVTVVSDEDWTGFPSRQDGKPKVLPYTDARVVEDFFQTPHRPSFKMCQEVIFVSNAYLDGSQEGLELRNYQQEDMFELDGLHGIGREVIGLPLNLRTPGMTVSGLTVGGDPVSDEVYLRDGSRIGFQLSKGKFYEDIQFEGPVRDAIGLRYLMKTAEGYSFNPSIGFPEKTKVVQVQVPCLEDSSQVFPMQAVASRQGAVRRSATLSRNGAEFVFRGSEIGDSWDFVVEEHGYAYTLFRGFCPESGEDQLQDLNSRLVTIENRSGKDVRIVGLSGLNPLTKNLLPVDGIWLLPRGLKEYNFEVTYDESYFELLIGGLERDAVFIELRRTHYDLQVPRGFWNALERDQRDSLHFSLGGEVFRPFKSGSLGRITVDLASDVKKGELQMEVSRKPYAYDFGFQKIENKNSLLLKPLVVQVVQGTGTRFTLDDGTVLPPGSSFLPVEIVKKDQLEAAGFKVEQVGGGDPAEPSFPRFSRAQDRGGSPQNAGSGTVLGGSQGSNAGGGQGGGRGRGNVVPEPPKWKRWLVPALAGLGVFLAILGIVLFLVLKNKGRDKDVTVKYVVPSRNDVQVSIRPLSDKEGRGKGRIKGAKVPGQKNVLVLDTSKVNFPLNILLEFEHEGKKTDVIKRYNDADSVRSVTTEAMDDLKKLVNTADNLFKDAVDSILKKYPESNYVKEEVERIQIDGGIAKKLSELERIRARILSMECKKSTVDSLKTVFLDDLSLWTSPHITRDDRSWYEKLYQFQFALFTEEKSKLNGTDYRNSTRPWGFKPDFVGCYTPEQAKLFYLLLDSPSSPPQQNELTSDQQDSVLENRDELSYSEMEIRAKEMLNPSRSSATVSTNPPSTVSQTSQKKSTGNTGNRNSRRVKRK